MGALNGVEEQRHVRTIPGTGLSYVWLADTVADVNHITASTVAMIGVSPQTLRTLRQRFQTQQRFQDVLLREVTCLIEPGIGVFFPTEHLNDWEIELFMFPLPPRTRPTCSECGAPTTDSVS
jgi:hypothetical protein